MQAPAEKRVACQVFATHSETGSSLSRRHGAGAERIGPAHEQAARQNTYGSFQGAHMDVHLEHLYILAGQERRCEGDDGGIVAAQDL
jgi:hypothetical protein